jgi:hypothetical protein
VNARAKHLPAWRPEPRVCVSCREQLHQSPYGCKEVELRTARQDAPSVTVRVLGTICRFCALVEQPSTEQPRYRLDLDGGGARD